MDTALSWYQNTALASTVGSSPTITAVLSALHALGFTCIMGGALFANLGRLGVLFPARPVRELTLPGSRLIALGLAISLPTGAIRGDVVLCTWYGWSCSELTTERSRSSRTSALQLAGLQRAQCHDSSRSALKGFSM